MSQWLEKKCEACEGGVEPLSEEIINDFLSTVPGWEYKELRLSQKFDFKNHYEAISFVNAVAWISHTENHHPIMEVGFRDVTIFYWTHAIDGISDNDFICAAKVNQLLN
ncbi:Transcriptional coactivator/pterin dehydratase [Lentisphaera araneosa HTCC2155]|jgi:4a-hydroxytetrahydrobiopterin dehydratase|uniref:Putative pterin-4-alpha-carbinolamine dehydratase n=1 Tax=Lentisphaera araneosa HTCC2155 TaxID=313628 RepID=A6DHD9_9BACT|nr:4a-hydroxytetrahydrobiopterin dehydratase [Lentisphaera araneosa]EDM29022.1 Transcriptional coactivator/pterin dehydratase [Lentisphaera araneosa HTCC2155]